MTTAASSTTQSTVQSTSPSRAAPDKQATWADWTSQVASSCVGTVATALQPWKWGLFPGRRDTETPKATLPSKQTSATAAVETIAPEPAALTIPPNTTHDTAVSSGKPTYTLPSDTSPIKRVASWWPGRSILQANEEHFGPARSSAVRLLDMALSDYRNKLDLERFAGELTEEPGLGDLLTASETQTIAEEFGRSHYISFSVNEFKALHRIHPDLAKQWLLEVKTAHEDRHKDEPNVRRLIDLYSLTRDLEGPKPSELLWTAKYISELESRVKDMESQLEMLKTRPKGSRPSSISSSPTISSAVAEVTIPPTEDPKTEDQTILSRQP